jgi:hypothetical protein
MISEHMQLVIETISHIVIGLGSNITFLFIKWNEVYKLICKIDTSMQNKRTTLVDRKKTEIMREARKKYKFISLFVTILGTVLIFCDLFDILILHFVENIVVLNINTGRI